MMVTAAAKCFLQDWTVSMWDLLHSQGMYVVIIIYDWMYGDIQRYTLNVYSGCETTLEVENVMMMQYKQ